VTDPAAIEAVARENPRRDDESWFAYVERLSVLAGLLKPEQAGQKPPGGKWSSAADVVRDEPEEWWKR
jgi:hypothetical protein